MVYEPVQELNHNRVVNGVVVSPQSYCHEGTASAPLVEGVVSSLCHPSLNLNLCCSLRWQNGCRSIEIEQITRVYTGKSPTVTYLHIPQVSPHTSAAPSW